MQSVYAQTPGTLDSTFGINGKVETIFGNGLSISNCNLVQNDGKILAAGVAYNAATDDDFVVVRYNTDGSLDTTFGTTGIVTTDIQQNHEQAFAMALQTDGKIVLAGQTGGFSTGAYEELVVIRYESNGTLDNTFGMGGEVIIPEPGGNLSYYINAIALQTDGKIVVAGADGFGIHSYAALFRFNTNGDLDTSFSQDGIVTMQIDSPLNVLTSVLIQPDGKIVAAGYTLNDIAVVRYNSNGTLDSSFATGGIAVIPNGLARSVILQPDNKIVVTGRIMGFKMCIIRYNTDGFLDNTFGIGGISITVFGSATSDSFQSVLQPDGKILTAATYHDGSNDRDYLLACHNSNGFLDSSFGSNGYVTTDFIGYDDEPRSLALQQDGKIVLSGYYSNGTNYYFGLARYIPDLTTNTLNIEISDTPLNIFPNPTHRNINVNVNPGASILILNVLGEIVFEKRLSNSKRENIELDVSFLSSGIYFIKSENELRKFVKE